MQSPMYPQILQSSTTIDRSRPQITMRELMNVQAKLHDHLKGNGLRVTDKVHVCDSPGNILNSHDDDLKSIA